MVQPRRRCGVPHRWAVADRSRSRRSSCCRGRQGGDRGRRRVRIARRRRAEVPAAPTTVRPRRRRRAES
ncbi:hypothetical protein HBB16_11895 [Pseudonocardia sp. MCCB 268]|nr:hypothetical protein [Pseudonocardia cytotoxica]